MQVVLFLKKCNSTVAAINDCVQETMQCEWSVPCYSLDVWKKCCKIRVSHSDVGNDTVLLRYGVG
jgi:hypothetical protein